jgi:hypothetical protein
MLTVADFRAIFPEFTVEAYPDTQVQFWLDSAANALNPRVWGARLNEGIALYVAHMLAVNTLKRRLASGGSGATLPGVPGLATGLVAAKSVGGASITYNTEVGQLADGGAFNLTTYGQEYLTIARSIAVGAMQF